MGVVIEPEIWVPNNALYIFLLVSCFFSIYYLPIKSATNILDHASSSSLCRFQRNFLALFALSSVIQGSWFMFGEYEFAYSGFSKEQILKSLYIGYAVSLIIGSFLGILFDLLGHKRSCLLFYLLHLFVGVLKIFTGCPTIWLTSICLSMASSMFSFSFETWMVVEHTKLGARQDKDSLIDFFWLMPFFECASFIGSQVLGNYLINQNASKSIISIWKECAALSLVAIISVTRGWKEDPEKIALKDYCTSFHRHVVSDKRIWLLAFAQACSHFSLATFWILWAPTVVADGRGVSLGLIYPCFLGFKMLGCTLFPWFNGPLILRLDEYLIYAFVIMGVSLAAAAYDYQDIEVLMILFYVFQACAGVVLPSLARLRTMYVPNEFRGGMMSLSLMPANATVLFFLLLRCHYECIENSTIIASGAFSMFSAAGCMLLLKKWGKQLHQSRHNL